MPVNYFNEHELLFREDKPTPLLKCLFSQTNFVRLTKRCVDFLVWSGFLPVSALSASTKNGRHKPSQFPKRFLFIFLSVAEVFPIKKKRHLSQISRLPPVPGVPPHMSTKQARARARVEALERADEEVHAARAT